MEESFFLFFLHKDQADVDTLFVVLYVWHEGLRKLFFRGTPQRSSPSFLELLRNFYLPCQLPIFCFDRGKNSPQGLPDEWGGVKKLSLQPKVVSTVKSLPDPPRNHPKACEINVRWAWRCTKFVSPTRHSRL
jgi:hypothetical protein